MAKNKFAGNPEAWKGYTVYYTAGSNIPDLRDPDGKLVDWYTRAPLGIVISDKEYQNQQTERAKEVETARERFTKTKRINFFLNSPTFPSGEYGSLAVAVPDAQVRTIAQEVEALERML